MGKKTRTLPGILADLKASQTHLEEAMEGVLSLERTEERDFAHLDLLNASNKILHAVEGLVRGDWRVLWDLASTLKGPEDTP